MCKVWCTIQSGDDLKKEICRYAIGCPKSVSFIDHVTLEKKRGAYIILLNHTKHACIV